MTHGRSFCSLVLMCMSEVASEIATASTPQSSEVWMSATFARFQPSTEAREAHVRDLLDDRPLVAAHDGDARLDLVDAHLVEHARDSDLLGVREDDAGGLLAVAKSGVVDHDGRGTERAVDRHAVREHLLHGAVPPPSSVHGARPVRPQGIIRSWRRVRTVVSGGACRGRNSVGEAGAGLNIPASRATDRPGQ